MEYIQMYINYICTRRRIIRNILKMTFLHVVPTVQGPGLRTSTVCINIRKICPKMDTGDFNIFIQGQFKGLRGGAGGGVKWVGSECLTRYLKKISSIFLTMMRIRKIVPHAKSMIYGIKRKTGSMEKFTELNTFRVKKNAFIYHIFDQIKVSRVPLYVRFCYVCIEGH